MPGYFEMDIKKGESIVFAASTSSIRTSSLKSLFDKEVDERAPRDNFFHCLVNAAHQFHNRTKKDERYILAGYPWFKCRARDTFIALPGLTLAIEEQDYFELVMKTAEKGLREFMKGKPVSVKIYEMEQPDVPLWAIWAVQQYAKEAGEEKCFNMYGKLVRDIVDAQPNKKSKALLTKRELEIVEACCAGLLGKEISEKFHISLRAVNSHKTNIFNKLGLSSSVEMVRFAIEHGII